MISTTPILINKLIKHIAQALHKKYYDEKLCTQYAWWSLEAVTKQSKADLMTQKRIALSEEQCDTLTRWIKNQVENHIPLQYLLGSVPFLDCNILVEPPILIPRQETESWCADIIEKLKTLPDQKLRILDLCTGSGCIATAVAKAIPHASVYALDISEHALSLAQKNANHNHVNVTMLLSDLFTNIPTGLLFDMILTNPPYISKQEWHILDPSVKEWEDTNALVAPDDGIGIIKQIILGSIAVLDPHSTLIKHAIPQLVIEIGHTQGATAHQLFHDAGFATVQIKKDIYGNDRIAVGYATHEDEA